MMTDLLASIVSALLAGGISMWLLFQFGGHWWWGILFYSVAYFVIRLLVFLALEYRCSR